MSEETCSTCRHYSKSIPTTLLHQLLFVSPPPSSVSEVPEAEDTTLTPHHRHHHHHPSEVWPRPWNSVWDNFKPSQQETAAEGIHFHATLLIHSFLLSSSVSGVSTKTLSPTWQRFAMDTSPQNREKYFLQTQTVCRMIQADREGVGWCTWARETLQAAGVNLCYSKLHREPVVALQGTTLRVGTKRFLICGLKKPESSDSERSRRKCFMMHQKSCWGMKTEHGDRSQTVLYTWWTKV